MKNIILIFAMLILSASTIQAQVVQNCQSQTSQNVTANLGGLIVNSVTNHRLAITVSGTVSAPSGTVQVTTISGATYVVPFITSFPDGNGNTVIRFFNVHQYIPERCGTWLSVIGL